MPSANDLVAAGCDSSDKEKEGDQKSDEKALGPKDNATTAKKHQRIVGRLRKKCAKSPDGVAKVEEPAPTIPLEECEKRVNRVWAILKHGILDADAHKDAWLINTAEANSKRGQFGTVLHPKWQPAPDTYFYHDEEIDALLVMDRSPETLAKNKGKAYLIGLQKDQVCCCDAAEHQNAKRFRMPLIHRGAQNLPAFQGIFGERS
jgi:hypothetical protein